MEDKPLSTALLLIALGLMLFAPAVSYVGRVLVPSAATAAQSAGAALDEKPSTCDLKG